MEYNLAAPREKIIEVLGINYEKFVYLLKIFSLNTSTSEFTKKQLDAFIQYLNLTKECTIDINYDDSIFTAAQKKETISLEEIINHKQKTKVSSKANKNIKSDVSTTVTVSQNEVTEEIEEVNDKQQIKIPSNSNKTLIEDILTIAPHQIEATANIIEEFKISDRTQLISACGTGKTFIAKEVTENILKSKCDTTTLILVPTLALLLQFYNSWVKNISIKDHKQPFVICGDDDLLSDNELKINKEDLKFTLNTSVDFIIDYLSNEQIEHKLLLCTYQSAKLIKDAMNEVNITIDLGIFDEAHKTVGCIDKDFALALFDENIKIHKRLFMTATPKHVSSNNQNVLTMNDEKVYGKVAYELSMREAINKGIIKDYHIVVSVIDSTLYKELKHIFKDLSKEQILDELLAVNFIKFIKEKKIKKSISFHGTIKESKRFVENKHIQNHLGEIITHLDGNTPSRIRNKELIQLDLHDEKHISNSRLLSEGIDVISIEAVNIFCASRSIVDITQRLGRIQRKEHKDDYKMGYLYIPVILDEVYADIGIDSTLGNYQYILDVLSYLKESDSQIKMFFNQKQPQEIIRELLKHIEVDSFNEIKEDSLKQFNSLITNIVNNIQIKEFESEDSEAKWNNAYTKVIEFKKEFERFPIRSNEGDKKTPENILGNWCARQRALYKNKLLPDNKIELLKGIGFQWNVLAENWIKTFLELELFIKENKFIPQSKRNGEYTPKKEKALRKWFNNQRFLKKEGRLEDWKLIKIDALLNNLDFEADLKDNDGVWEQSYQRFMTFVKENKKLPCDVKNDSEQKLIYGWYINQRNKFNNNELSAVRIEKLNLCGLKWVDDSSVFRWEAAYKEILKLNKKYEGIPRHSSNRTEKNVIKKYHYYMKKFSDLKEPTKVEIENLNKLKNLVKL